MKSIKESMKAIANAYYEEEISEEEEIRADERRKVLEWLANGNVFLRRIGSDTLTTIDDLISEYEKEQK